MIKIITSSIFILRFLELTKCEETKAVSSQKSEFYPVTSTEEINYDPSGKNPSYQSKKPSTMKKFRTDLKKKANKMNQNIGEGYRRGKEQGKKKIGELYQRGVGNIESAAEKVKGKFKKKKKN